jgi:hypothetical protein
LVLVAISWIRGIDWEEIKSIRYIGLFLFISFLTAGFLWFLDLFTGVISKARFIQIIIMCYVFTIFALFSSILMFAALGWQGPTTQGSTLLKIMTKTPIGIVKGCVFGTPDNEANKDWIATELKCNNNSNDVLAQWVINLGGTTEPLPPAARKQRTGNAKDQEGGSSIDIDRSWPSVKIYGGVVVPLYVVILSLMGGAISMTRRVPEYQRRVYLKKEEKEHISREDARQFLVFQIMQFFTAPLIAITAYYLLKPDTRTMSVVLGFASGFASEIVLGAIRGLVTKLGPAEAQTTGGRGSPS